MSYKITNINDEVLTELETEELLESYIDTSRLEGLHVYFWDVDIKERLAENIEIAPEDIRLIRRVAEI